MYMKVEMVNHLFELGIVRFNCALIYKLILLTWPTYLVVGFTQSG